MRMKKFDSREYSTNHRKAGIKPFIAKINANAHVGIDTICVEGKGKKNSCFPRIRECVNALLVVDKWLCFEQQHIHIAPHLMREREREEIAHLIKIKRRIGNLAYTPSILIVTRVVQTPNTLQSTCHTHSHTHTHIRTYYRSVLYGYISMLSTQLRIYQIERISFIPISWKRSQSIFLFSFLKLILAWCDLWANKKSATKKMLIKQIKLRSSFVVVIPFVWLEECVFLESSFRDIIYDSLSLHT